MKFSGKICNFFLISKLSKSTAISTHIDCYLAGMVVPTDNTHEVLKAVTEMQCNSGMRQILKTQTTTTDQCRKSQKHGGGERWTLFEREQLKSFSIKALWQTARRNKTKREKPGVRGYPKRPTKSNTSENSTSAAMFSVDSTPLCTAQLFYHRITTTM